MDLFGTAAIAGIDWLILAGFGLATFLIVEAEKAVARRILGRR